MRFFNSGSNGGEDRKFWLEMGGSQVWGDWFYNGWDGKLLVMKIPLYFLPPLLLQILSNSLSTTSLSPPTSIPTVLYVVLILWLNAWSRHIWSAILLNDNMDLRKTRLVSLLPKVTWCVFYATKHQVYWGLIHNVAFYWYCDLISQTHKHTQHTRGQQTDTAM